MERSSALPLNFYRDPAEVVERHELVQLGCRACVSCELVLNRPMCQDERNQAQKGVPRIGFRCKFFREVT